MAPSVVHVCMTKCNRAALTVVITGRNLSLISIMRLQLVESDLSSPSKHALEKKCKRIFDIA